MNKPAESSVLAELKRLADAFFDAVSFKVGEKPAYSKISALFIESGLLIKNIGPVPEISSTEQFIRPRQAAVDAGELTRFHEAEIAETTEVFGRVAQRFSSYTKSGVLNGVAFEARGMISTQFILTPEGWRMTSMAWDDEKPGLEIPALFGFKGAK